MSSELIGAIIGSAWGLSIVITYLLGRIVQMKEDHQLEASRLRRCGIIR